MIGSFLICEVVLKKEVFPTLLMNLDILRLSKNRQGPFLANPCQQIKALFRWCLYVRANTR